MKRPLTALASAALALGALAGTSVAAPPPAEAAPYCGIRWGSLTKWLEEGNLYSSNTIKDVRSGRHTCFDRLVIDVRGDVKSYLAFYSDNQPHNGLPYQLRGPEDLLIEVKNPSVNTSHKLTWDPGNPRELVDVTGYRTFRQVGLINYWSENGDGRWGKQAVTTFAIGVRARLPFRVFQLDGPGSHSRLVVDVAHRW